MKNVCKTNSVNSEVEVDHCQRSTLSHRVISNVGTNKMRCSWVKSVLCHHQFKKPCLQAAQKRQAMTQLSWYKRHVGWMAQIIASAFNYLQPLCQQFWSQGTLAGSFTAVAKVITFTHCTYASNFLSV